MNAPSPKPYKLHNKIQNYEWGTKNENAFIPNLLGIKAEKDVPYAELWIGSHPKSPSEIEIDGKKYPLNEVIQAFPEHILGEQIYKTYGAQLPFLLKVLSAAKALSIQLHPNKKQAERLNRKDPKNYPDANHKPEIAVSLDGLTALGGFRPIHDIKENLVKNPEISEFVGTDLPSKILNAESDSAAENYVKELYATLMRKADDTDALLITISQWADRLTKKSNRSDVETQFLTQHELYGNDIGLFSFFFFNLIHLKPGQAIFTDAGIPHAYIGGNIIECMANSDNVVRAGLTPKFKDVSTLLDILVYNFSAFEILNEEQNRDHVVYKTTAPEFEVSGFSKPAGFKQDFSSDNKPSVCIVTDGKLTVSSRMENVSFKKGESFMIPASLEKFTLSADQAVSFYSVTIPG